LTTNCCPRRLETDLLLDDRAIFAVLLFAMMAQDWVSVKLIFLLNISLKNVCEMRFNFQRLNSCD